MNNMNNQRTPTALDLITVATVTWNNAPQAMGRIIKMNKGFGWTYFNGQTGKLDRNFLPVHTPEDALVQIDNYHEVKGSQ